MRVIIYNFVTCIFLKILSVNKNIFSRCYAEIFVESGKNVFSFTTASFIVETNVKIFF